MFTDEMTHLVYGVEVCPTTGRQHYQYHVTFRTKRTKGGAMKLLGISAVAGEADGSRCERVKDIKESIKYCKKGETGVWKGEPCPRNAVVEFGAEDVQGDRTDLVELAAALRSGETTVDQITMENPMAIHQYGRTLERIEDLVQRKKPRNQEKPRIYWFWGPTGSGKTREVMSRLEEQFMADNVYVWEERVEFACGYAGQEYVLFDDYRGQIPFATLLKYLDIYQLGYFHRKGKTALRCSTKNFYFTAPAPPEVIYKGQAAKGPDPIGQLIRRIKEGGGEIRQFGPVRSGLEQVEPDVPPPPPLVRQQAIYVPNPVDDGTALEMLQRQNAALIGPLDVMNQTWREGEREVVDLTSAETEYLERVEFP